MNKIKELTASMNRVQKAREFRETHKMKTGWDFRAEMLKLSKEEIYDYLDTISSDTIYGWSQRLSESENNEKYLKRELERLKSQICINCAEKY